MLIVWSCYLLSTHAECALSVNWETHAFECADLIATMPEDDPEFDEVRSIFLCYMQRAFDDGETLLHAPYKYKFCAKDTHLKTIEIALCRAIGRNTDFFESVLLQQDDAGDTPFHAAIWYGHEDWLQLLIRVALACTSACSLAYVEEILLIKNKQGQSIFDLALAEIKKFTTQGDPLRAFACSTMFVSLVQFRHDLEEKSSELY